MKILEAAVTCGYENLPEPEGISWFYIHYSFQSEFWFPITLAARISFFFFFSSLSLSNPRFSSLGLVMMCSQLWRFNLSFEFKPLFIFLILWILHLWSLKFYLHLNISIGFSHIYIYIFHLVIEEFLIAVCFVIKKNLCFFVGFAAKYLASS